MSAPAADALADGLLLGVDLATFSPSAPPAPGVLPDGYGSVPDGALAWRGGVIAYAGPAASLPSGLASLPRVDPRSAGASGAAGGPARRPWVLPALIDCHTHLVFAGDRSDEFEARLSGATYAQIASRGGGILSTVRATRAASEDELVEAALPRLDALLAEGVGTVEVKSGYGLDLETELKMLRAARRLGKERAVSVRTTFLGAHAVPPEFAGRADAYLDFLLGEVLPAAAAEGLADAVDVFCESIAFSAAQAERVFEAARSLGLPVKVHAEQLSDLGASVLAARYGALSCDHLERLGADGVRAMASSGCAAVLLPGAFFFLRESRLPPVAALRAAGVPLAVSTDCNPGTSPLTSLLGACALSCVLFGLTPAEALAGCTREAARALGLADRGRLEAGLRADFVLFDARRPASLCAGLGAASAGASRPRAWIAGVERA